MAKPKHVKLVNLYCNSATDYSIVDQTGRVYTTDEARAVIAEGRLADYNRSFQRLADLDFDIEALKKFYAEASR